MLNKDPLNQQRGDQEYNPVSKNYDNTPLRETRRIHADFPQSQHPPAVIAIGTLFPRPRWNFNKADTVPIHNYYWKLLQVHNINHRNRKNNQPYDSARNIYRDGIMTVRKSIYDVARERRHWDSWWMSVHYEHNYRTVETLDLTAGSMVNPKKAKKLSKTDTDIHPTRVVSNVQTSRAPIDRAHQLTLNRSSKI